MSKKKRYIKIYIEFTNDKAEIEFEVKNLNRVELLGAIEIIKEEAKIGD